MADQLETIIPIKSPPSTNRRLKKRAIVGDVLWSMLARISQIFPDLEFMDALVVFAIMVNAADGRKTGAADLPYFLNPSPATTSRRLNALMAQGYLKRTRDKKTFLYEPAEEVLRMRAVSREGNMDALDLCLRDMTRAIKAVAQL